MTLSLVFNAGERLVASDLQAIVTEINNMQATFPTIFTGRLAADTTGNATSTPADITGLSFSAAANTAYWIDAMVYFTAPTANDFLLSASAPSGATFRGQPLSAILTASSDDATPRLGVGTAASGALLAAGGLGSTEMGVRLKGTLITSSTAGTYKLQHCVNVVSGGGASIVKARSSMIVFKLS